MSGLVEFSKSVGVRKADSYANRNAMLRPYEFNSRKENVAYSAAVPAAVAAGAAGYVGGRNVLDAKRSIDRAKKYSPDGPFARRSRAIASPAGQKIMYGRALNATGNTIRRNAKFAGLIVGASALGGALERHKGSPAADKSRAAADRYLAASRSKRKAANEYRASRLGV